MSDLNYYEMWQDSEKTINRLRQKLFNENLTIAVCVAGAPPFITAVNGKVILEVLGDIEHQLIEDELADGFYVFTITHYTAETGEFGRIEIPEYWELDQVSFKALQEDP